MTVRILTGDCRELLKTLPDQSVHCCTTSPPYFGLRDYGIEPVTWPAIAYSPMPGLPACVEIPAMVCSLGLESTLEAFIGHMVLVFREVHRVLRDDGTLWLNIGDSYANDTKWGGQTSGKHVRALRGNTGIGRRRQQTGLKSKDLMGQTWRLAFALQADGWYLRQDIIWSKPNPMPESVRDRCTKAHEYVFLLSKSEKYYYDFAAMKEPVSESTHARMSQNVQAQIGSDRAHAGGKTNGRMKAVLAGTSRRPDDDRRPKAWDVDMGSIRTLVDGHARTSTPKSAGNGVGFGHGFDAVPKPRVKNNESFDAAMAVMPSTRNRRSVWTIPTHSFKDAHFATFPPALIEPCIKAGCPEGGTVLDPFGGAGTTGLVADQLQRDAVLIELNPEYVAIAERRIANDKWNAGKRTAQLFAEVAA